MLYIQENWNGDCPNGKELDQKDKNTLPSHTSSVEMTLHHLVYHSFPKLPVLGCSHLFVRIVGSSFRGRLRIALILLFFQNFLF